MRRPIALLALWLTAAIVCTTLGWFTVGIVSGQTRESSLPPLVQTTTTLDSAGPGVVRPRPAITTGSTATTSTSTTTTTAAPGTPLEAPSPAVDADPAASATLPGAPSLQGTAAPLPRAPEPTTSATINCRGGSVAVNYDASTGTVTLLWATPNDGFTMDVRAIGPDEVEVRYASDDAESRVFAWWDSDPRQRVEERN